MNDAYPVQYAVDYPDRDLNRVSTAFRIFTAIPILILIGTITGYQTEYDTGATTTTVVVTGTGLLFAAARSDDHLPREVPALVVRLEPRAHAVQQPRRRLLRADGRPLSVDRRPPGRAPRLRATRTPGPT